MKRTQPTELGIKTNTKINILKEHLQAKVVRPQQELRAALGARKKEKKAKMTTTTKNLAEDIVVDILTRVPVKSLMRFKCIRKSWYALVEDPNFITNHYLKQTTLNSTSNFNNSHLLVKCIGKYKTDDHYFSALSTDTLCVYENIHLPCFKKLRPQIEVLGPCNGILCLYDDYECLTLWNPATREFRNLPKSCVQRHPQTELVSYGCIGFGYDPKTNDFKVVRFVYNWLDDYGDCAKQVELYTLGTDSWKELSSPVEYGVVEPFQTMLNTYVNGAYHWLANERISEKIDDFMVVTFDMVDEVFQTTPLPHLGASWVEYFLELALFNDTLAVYVYPREGNEKCFDLWVMKEYGVKESWTKQLTIGPISGVERPLGLWKNDGLFLENEDGQLLFYDPTTKELKNLQVKGQPRTLQVCIYVESLYPINGIQEHEDEPPSIRSQTTLKVCEATSNST